MASGVKIGLFDRGKFIGTRTFSTIEAMHARGLVALRYNTKGYLVAAHCIHLPRLGAEPPDQRQRPAATLPPATRYSYRDRQIVAQPWDLKRLNGTRGGVHYTKGTNPADFLGVVGSCLRTALPTAQQLRNNHSMTESLYVTLVYEPNAGSRLSIARVEQHPIFNNLARIALDQAERRQDPQAEQLERLLETVLPGFQEQD